MSEAGTQPDKYSVPSREELEQLYAENDRLRAALSAARDICESAYACQEWLRSSQGRTATRDDAMENIRKILATKHA
jgi:hypothetical protein